MDRGQKQTPARPLLQWGRFCFAPCLLPVLATLLGLPILLALGFWQLDRADQKRMLQEEFLTHSRAPALTVSQVATQPEQYRFYPVALSGHYDNQHQFLLDNQIDHGRIGYQVLTPFYQTGNATAVLVNRGWIPQGISRQQLPALGSIVGPLSLQGVVKIPSNKPFMLSKNHETFSHWPHRIQAVQWQELSRDLQAPLYPFVILLGPDQPTGFVRDWRPINMQPQRHVGYAVQWFSLAMALFLYFIFTNIRRNNEDVRNG